MRRVPRAWRRVSAHRAAIGLVTILLPIACGGTNAAPAAPDPRPLAATTPPIRVLMVTTTLGFRHDSIPTARQTMTELASRGAAFTVTTTEATSDVTAASFAATDVLMFALTTGELPFDAAQKSAIVAFVNNGGGFIGIHSAADTLYDWPDYGRLVGAYFREHPWTQEASVTVEDRGHPINAGLGASWRITEEFYAFRQNPRPLVHVLLSLDAVSVGAEGDYPLAWTQSIGGGRAYYNALGHFDATWRDAAFQSQLVNAIRWAARRE